MNKLTKLAKKFEEKLAQVDPEWATKQEFNEVKNKLNLMDIEYTEAINSLKIQVNSLLKKNNV